MPTAATSASPGTTECGHPFDLPTAEGKDTLFGVADPRASAALTLSELEDAIRRSWGADTSDDPEEWSPDNPARGQCGVTALVLHDLLGGDILIADVFRRGDAVERHAWNRLPSGLEIDLTREQFRGGETLGPPAEAEPLVKGHCGDRCRLLATRVDATLADRTRPTGTRRPTRVAGRVRPGEPDGSPGR